MENKETAVDWLLKQFEFINIKDKVFESDWEYFIETAKEIEKKQIIDAYHINPLETKWGNIGENYYKELYGK